MINLLLLTGILLILGFFAGIEIAFVSVNKLSVELKKKQGRKTGIILSDLLDNPYTFVGVCITGYSIFLVVYGLIISRLLEPFWAFSGIQKLEGSGLIKSAAEILLSVALVLVFEFLFRAVFRAKSDVLLGFFARIMKLLHELLRPFVNILVETSIWILRYLFNVKMDENAKPFTRIDLEHYYQQTKEANEDSQELNQELFENALSLSGIKIRSCLVPRTEVVGVSLEIPLEEARQKMVETRLSKLIVYEKNIDNIVGYIHQLDMLKNNESIRDILLPIPTVPETMSVTDLISKFSTDRKSIAWVVDEFGGTAGIVTMEDLLEEIFGEIEDEYDTDEKTEQKLSDSEYVLNGRLELDHLAEKYGLSLQAGKDAETLSGFIIKKNGTIPKVKDTIIVGNYRFEILQMSETRIEQVKLHIL